MHTSLRGLFFGFFFLFALSSIVSAAEPGVGTFTTISVTVQVKGPAGLDMKTVSVELLGMNRPLLEIQKTTQTDAQGLASFSFVDASWDAVQESADATACQGQYHIIATASGTAGAVSPILCLESEKPAFDEDPANEWGPSYGKPVDLRELAKNKQPLVLTLEKGNTIKGKVLTSDQKPLPGVTINMYQDLHADSHTGKGREIFGMESITDAQGNFSFSPVFPNTVYLGDLVASDSDTQPSWFWKSTQLNGQKYEYQENRIPLASQTADLNLVLVVAKERYQYSGTIQTKDGKPVADAGMNLSVAYHPDCRDYIDSHTFVDGKTDAQGKFSLETDAAFANFLTVAKEGFQELTLDNENASPAFSLLKPGSHTLTLEK